MNCLGIKICLRAQDQSAITIVWSNQAGIQMSDSKNCILIRLRNTTLLIKMLWEIWCFSPWNFKSKIEKLSKIHYMDMRADYLQNWVNQSICLFLMIDNGSGKSKLVLLSKFVLPWKKINYDTRTLIFMSRKAQLI